MKSTRSLAAATLAFAIMAAPAFALADDATTTATTTVSTATTTVQTNSSDLMAQIQALLAQINALKAQLADLVKADATGTMPSGSDASSTPSLGCPNPPRNLGIGARGDDVREVQQFLASTSPDIFSSSNVTGFFGPRTARAMARFQEENGIASSTTGFVGPMTRSFFGRHCGEVEGEGHLNGTANSWMDQHSMPMASTTDWSHGFTLPHFPGWMTMHRGEDNGSDS